MFADEPPLSSNKPRFNSEFVASPVNQVLQAMTNTHVQNTESSAAQDGNDKALPKSPISSAVDDKEEKDIKMNPIDDSDNEEQNSEDEDYDGAWRPKAPPKRPTAGAITKPLGGTRPR